MIYPSITEYLSAIQSAEDNFDSLSSLRPVTDSHGKPVMSSGNFAVVFKMKDEQTGKLYAVKCFIKDQEGRDTSYAKIADELAEVHSDYLCHIRYLPRELFVDTSNDAETEFPVLQMDWVEGMPLDRYLRAHLHSRGQLAMLAYRFCQMASWLLTQPFAHGDLKPDNILVRPDGTLVLVDYDGMYVPAMRGESAREMGSPDYRHPLRTADAFDEHIDDFALASIALSLKAISLSPSLYETYDSGDRLLFGAADYRDLSQCTAFKALIPLMADAELSRLCGLFLLAQSQQNLSTISPRLFELTRPKKEPERERLSTKVTDVDRAESITDELGAKYSKDGLRLLEGPDRKECAIKSGTFVICDMAFSGCESLQSVVIPNSVTTIGKSAFSGCRSLQNVTIPDSVTTIGDWAFASCESLQSMTIPDSVTIIEIRAFSCCCSLHSLAIPDSVTAIRDMAFWECISLQSLVIPNSVTTIGDWAFDGCKSLQSVTIPDSVTTIGERAFSGCKFLLGVSIPDSVTTIGERAFSECKSLQSVSIPSSVTTIGKRAFYGCESLQSVIIPDTVITIGGGAFNGCHLTHFECFSHHFIWDGAALYDANKQLLIGLIKPDIENFKVPDSVTTIGDGAFDCCRSLLSVTIPDSVTTIGERAFSECKSLQSVVVPNSVTTIGDWAFEGCKSLRSVTIPDSTTTIGYRAFGGCSSLQSVVIPDSVIAITQEAFSGCESLQSVVIPDSVTTIGNLAFGWCGSLQSVTIPDSVTTIGELAFWCCTSLQSVTIPDSVTTIRKSAFGLCTSLQSVTIPDSVTTIGESAFCRCESLANIYIPQGTKSKFAQLLPDLVSKLKEL